MNQHVIGYAERLVNNAIALQGRLRDYVVDDRVRSLADSMVGDSQCIYQAIKEPLKDNHDERFSS